MDHAIMCQFMCKHFPKPNRRIRRCNVHITTREQTAATGGMRAVLMKIRNIVIIVVILREEENYMFAMSAGPRSIFQPLANLYHSPFAEGQHLSVCLLA